MFNVDIGEPVQYELIDGSKINGYWCGHTLGQIAIQEFDNKHITLIDKVDLKIYSEYTQRKVIQCLQQQLSTRNKSEN